MSHYSKTKRKCGVCFNFWTISNTIVKTLPCFLIMLLHSILLFILTTDLLSVIPLRTSLKYFLQKLILNMLPNIWFDTNWIVSLKKCFMETSKLDTKHFMISMTYKKSTFFKNPAASSAAGFYTEMTPSKQLSCSLHKHQCTIYLWMLSHRLQLVQAHTVPSCFPDCSLAVGSFLMKTLELTNMMPEWVGLLTQNHNYHFKVDTG